MRGKKNRRTNSINRRSFVGNTVKLLTLGTLLMPLAQACNNNNKSSKPTLPNPEKDKKRTPHTAKKPRKKWHHESLVMNSESNVIHFPTSKMYVYYDEIKSSHLQELSLATWAARLKEPVRLNKQQSGNILEIIAMQNLAKGVPENLYPAMNTLAYAFSKDCENTKGINPNTTNFRIHELMLQLITLNNTIPDGEKWAVFNGQVKKPSTLRKRQKWMETETSFNERVRYILERQNDYITRLTKRAARYSFT